MIEKNGTSVAAPFVENPLDNVLYLPDFASLVATNPGAEHDDFTSKPFPGFSDAISSEDVQSRSVLDVQADDASAGGSSDTAAQAVVHLEQPSASDVAIEAIESATSSMPLPATGSPTASIEVDVVFPTEPEGDPAGHIDVCCCPACLNPREDIDEAEGEPVAADENVSAGSEASLDVMADYLRLGYWGNEVGARHNLGQTGSDPNDGVLYYNVNGTNGDLAYSGGLNDSNGISNARAELVRDAFDFYEAVLGINFVETTSTDNDVVDFFFIDNESGAFASSPRWSDGTIYASYINVQASWSGGTSTYDDYTLQTIFHEIGHALGLGHQGQYNGSGGYEGDALYVNDSWQATMMSYFSQSENTAITASYEFLQTPMAVDWLALDDIYGQWGFGTDNAFTDDTVYGFNTNISADTSRIWNEFADYADRTASTIIDAGGTDTVDFSGYSADQLIDLTVQSGSMTSQNASDIGGRIGNLTFAAGTVIENAVGGSGDDMLIGNEADNVLTGGAGNDTLSGKAGNDSLYGGDGIDTALFESAFADFELEIQADRTSILFTDTEVVATDDGQNTVFSDLEFVQYGDYALSSIELDNGGLIASISTQDQTGETLSHLSLSDDGRTSYSIYDQGIIATKILTELDGDLRTTSYDLEGARESVFFEDLSNSRDWESYTNLYDTTGARTNYGIVYDNGDVLDRTYADGVTVTKILTDADGDLRTTNYDAEGMRDSFVFQDISESRDWQSYTNTYDNTGARTNYDVTYDNGDVLNRSFADGIIELKVMAEADGDLRTVMYDATGTRESLVFEDISDTRDWASYTNTYDQDGVFLDREYFYDVA